MPTSSYPRHPAPPITPRFGATVSRRAAERLLAGHVWVYQSDVLAMGGPGGKEEAVAPGLVPVHDQGGRMLGTALWSPTSQISLRLVSREHLDPTAWIPLLRQRLQAAFERREALLDEGTDSCRLVFSEADELPGIIIDKYAGIAVFQLLAAGLDTAAVREAVVEELSTGIAGLRTVLERPDPRIRELESLAAPALGPLWSATGPLEDAETANEFRLNGLRFHHDSNAGQKTGAFLDQRLNYRLAAQYGHGEALDVCTYQGGFALHLATTCRSVTGLDTSEAALEVAERNLELNREALGGIEVDWVKGDAFAVLRDWSDNGSEYDTIVLDPPAFAKTKRAADNAMRGYKELNLRAFQMLRPGGTLVTCSCSHHVSLQDFQDVVAAAAGDAGRRVRLVERTGAALDHPVILTIPETEYLKCLVLEVE
ncbi:class I SAM-dependent rRNA methyltransferase [Acidipila sp. EB88]|uniref:class I SAM-dependent rRNA methyltransferase n=1 Tax=Acidipila sp. EB88 TaxID=2305226 RepID=UPI000F5E80D5|nr:class I SAM-dependent rRNA methyltransferase [Acidipila sp. EB88]RRA48004.1 class I SAM-dependent rRNA methyltransferase [Acidipila sp. EB88]